MKFIKYPPEDESVLRFSLIEGPDEGIRLAVVDAKGTPVDGGNICRITREGLYCYKGARALPEELLDTDARIKLHE